MGGRHQICSGSKAKAAAIYPSALYRAMLRGIRNQVRADRGLREGMFGFMSLDGALNLVMENNGDAFEATGHVLARADQPVCF